MSNHHNVHLTYLTILSVNYTSRKLKRKGKGITTVLPMSSRKNACETLSTGPDTQ